MARDPEKIGGKGLNSEVHSQPGPCEPCVLFNSESPGVGKENAQQREGGNSSMTGQQELITNGQW